MALLCWDAGGCHLAAAVPGAGAEAFLAGFFGVAEMVRDVGAQVAEDGTEAEVVEVESGLVLGGVLAGVAVGGASGGHWRRVSCGGFALACSLAGLEGGRFVPGFPVVQSRARWRCQAAACSCQSLGPRDSAWRVRSSASWHSLQPP